MIWNKFERLGSLTNSFINPEVRLRNYASAFGSPNHGTDENAPPEYIKYTQHPLTSILLFKTDELMVTISAQILRD